MKALVAPEVAKDKRKVMEPRSGVYMQEGYQVYLQHAGCFSVEVYTMYYCVVYENGSVKFYERNLE